jgi:hypothetical protein
MVMVIHRVRDTCARDKSVYPSRDKLDRDDPTEVHLS